MYVDGFRALEPVTQLYVSVDAATRDTLKAIDRPLFKDFWERFLECLRLLRDKHQRTVYRCVDVICPADCLSAVHAMDTLPKDCTTEATVCYSGVIWAV